MTFQHHLSANQAQPNHVDTGDGCSSDRIANNLPRRRTILLVEDEPFVREATRGILENAGFEVLPAFDVQDAIKVYDEQHRSLDLVMTDMVLPGGTGQQLGHELRQRAPELVVLVTSGYGNPDFDTEFPESKTYFLAKPYTRRTLVDKIEKILGPRTLTRATQAG
jgi:two-component system cell cycle sensor histidine kinase/response regulator CckA